LTPEPVNAADWGATGTDTFQRAQTIDFEAYVSYARLARGDDKGENTV